MPNTPDYPHTADSFLEAQNKTALCADNSYVMGLARTANFFVNNLNEKKALQIADAVLTCLDKTANKRAYNIFLNIKEIIERKTELVSFPQALFIEPTGKCNYRCIMCSQYYDAEMPEKQETELIEFFDYAVEIMWIGGEPLMYKNFAYLMDKAHQAGVKQCLVSNASLMTENIIKKLIAYGVNLHISMDGANKQTYEKIRLGGKFENVIANLEILKKYKQTYPAYQTRLNAVVLQENYKELYAFADFAQKYNFNEFTFFSKDIIGDYPAGILEYIKEHKPIITKNFEEKGIRCNWHGNFNGTPKQETCASPIAACAESDDAASPEPEKINERRQTAIKDIACYMPWNSFMYAARHSVRPGCPCHFHDTGWQTQPTLKQMWNGAKMKQCRQQLLKNDFSGLCKGCALAETKRLFVERPAY